jgi:hypothetical protein
MDPTASASGEREKVQENGHGEKATQIRDACRKKDLDALRDLSTSEGGLVSDDLRKLACACFPEPIYMPTRLTIYIGPLLLGCGGQDNTDKTEDGGKSDWKELPKHVDEDQVQLDVDRSFIYYPTGTISHPASIYLLSHLTVMPNDELIAIPYNDTNED